MFCKKGVLKNLANFTGKHLCWSLFLIKLQVFRPATLSKRDSHTVIFLWNLQNLKNTYFEEYLPTTACVVSFSWLYVHYYAIDFLTKNKMQRRGLQKSKTKTVGNRKKKFFQLIHLRKSYFFIFAFLQKMLNVSPEHSFNVLRFSNDMGLDIRQKALSFC